MGFVRFKERGVGHLPRLSVSHARLIGGGLTVFRDLSKRFLHTALSVRTGRPGDSACLRVVNGGHPSHEGQSHKTVSTDHNFGRKRSRAEPDSNRGRCA